MSAEYVIHKDGQENTFEDEQQFRDTVDLLEQNDVDYETETVGEGEETDDAQVTDSDPNKPETDEPADTTATKEATPVTDESADLPDRELTDDPIEWLKQGSDEFVTTIKGTPVITKKGFRVLQHKYDISTGSEIIIGPEETDHEFARAKAWAEMPDGRRAEAHASAHTDRGDDHFLLTSMADTRAKSRALSDVTGVGVIAAQEYAEDMTTDK